MKLVKIIISLAFVVMAAYGWLSVGGEMLSDSTDYAALVEQGDASYERELYQDAYNHYTEALKIEASEALKVKQVQAYTDYYTEEKAGEYSVRKTLLSLLDEARTDYPSRMAFAEQEAALYLEAGEYGEAKKVCEEALESGSSEILQEDLQTIRKSFTLNYRYYSEYTEALNGYFTVTTGVTWHLLTSDGATESSKEYVRMGQIGAEGLYFVQEEEKGSRFYDLDGVVKGNVSGTYLSAGVYSGGLCPVEKEEGQWYYIDLYGNEILGPYLTAGSFVDGVSAVQAEENVWYLINTEGERVTDKAFRDIRLGFGGEYLSQGVMAAADSDGVYALYDSGGNRIGNFSCEDMDLVSGDGLTAFMKDGKWGFVNVEGEVVIEAQYSQAKSFRNGLAAVCSDGLWGFINEGQELVTEYQFYDAGYVTEAGTVMISDEDGLYRLLQYNYPEELVN